MMKSAEQSGRNIFTDNIVALGINYPHIASRLSRNNPLSILPVRSNPFILKLLRGRSTLDSSTQPTPFSAPYKNVIFIGVHGFLRFKRQANAAPPESFRIVVYEPNIDVFQLALQEFDLTGEFRREHMTFVVGSNIYFAGIKALRLKRVYEKEMMYSVYGACRSFFNYTWPLEVFSEEDGESLVSRCSSSLRRLLQFTSVRLTYGSLLTPKRDFKENCARHVSSLFLQLKLAHEFILRGKSTEKRNADRPKVILVLREPRLWNWAELFTRGFSESGFDVEFVQIDNDGEYMRRAIELALTYHPCILVTINRYAFENSSAAFALEEVCRESGIPYVSFILDHLDYFYWETEPLVLDDYPKYALIVYDRYFQENYAFGRKTFLLNPLFSYYVNKKMRGNYRYDICVTNRPREKNMKFFPEQEILYRKILDLPADPSVPISARLHILLWKLVNKIDEEYDPNINRHAVLKAVRCFKMGFDSFFRRDVAKVLCDNFESVAFFGGNEWKKIVPVDKYKGMVSYNEIREIYSRSRIIVDSFISWSDTTVHDYISLSEGGFTIFHKPALCYNAESTMSFEYFSNFEELRQKVSHYLSHEEERVRRLDEIQAAMDKHFHFDDYFNRVGSICRDLMADDRPAAQTREERNDFGTHVRKCEISLFPKETEQFMVSFMAAIAFYYGGYGRKANKLIKEAKQLRSAPCPDLDLFEMRVKQFDSQQWNF